MSDTFKPICHSCKELIPMGTLKMDPCPHCGAIRLTKDGPRVRPMHEVTDLDNQIRSHVLTETIKALDKLKDDRARRLVVRGLMEIYEVRGEWEDETP